MKTKRYLFLFIILLAAHAAFAQNAQQLYFNQLAVDYDYQAASFVVDTPPAGSPVRRAFLLWSRNFTRDRNVRGISVDEFDQAGNYLSEQINFQPGLPTEFLLPKKIIKAKRVKGYYMLAYVIKSPHLISGIPVYSTPLIIRLDDNLNPVWIYKIHYTSVSTANAQTVIEYNDVIESSNSDIILAGRFSDAPGQQNRLLLSRLSNAGAMLWTYQYYLNTCNAEGLSIAEAVNRNIALTGYIEECLDTFSGPRRLLYAEFTSAGSPFMMEKMSSYNEALAGTKIVRHTNTASGNEFFITGYIDLVTPTGINKQILLLDIRQGGAPLSFHHIGDAGPEAANDLTFVNSATNTYDLYLTGYTGSYYSNVKTEVFFLHLKYSSGLASLTEFSTFPSASSEYIARRGLEIKSAGRQRFAILANADFSIPPQQRIYSHVHIRDLNDFTGECIKQHRPPVTRYPTTLAPVTYNFPRLPFSVYRDDLKRFDKVYPRPECGTFYIDPYSTFSLARTAPPVSQLPAAKELPAMRVYPNPVSDRLYIDYGSLSTPGIITVRVYTTDMRLVREARLEGGNRSSIPLSGLHNGLYFVQVQHNGASRIFQVKKE
jgi:hypothetical protein